MVPERAAPLHLYRVTEPAEAAHQTLDELLMPVLERAYGLALRLVRNRADAEDLTQEAALAACRGFGTFRQGTNFRAWFFQIVTHCFYAQHRRRRPEADLDVGDVPELYLYERATELGLLGKVKDPARQLLDDIDREQIDQALQALPEEFRVVAALYFVEDLSYAEIASIVTVPVGTVRSRLHRGRKLLQQQLWRLAAERGLQAGAPRRDG